jgi:hypothetical protein
VPDANRNVDFVDSPFQDFDTEHTNHFSNPCLHNFRRVNKFEPLQGGEKTIPVSINKRHPAIFHFACKTGDKKEILPDTLLKQKILAYIDISTDNLHKFEQWIKETLDGS